VDSWTAEAVEALRDGGVDVILLKGPVIAEWLYDRGESRPYADADLLVSVSRRPRCERLLTGLGYALRDPEGEELLTVSGPHAQTWQRADGATIDLHHSLPGEVYVEGLVWPTLWERRDHMELAGVEVPVLDIPSRALMVALHVFHHGREHRGPMEDLRRALARAPDEVWTEGAVVAEDILALPQFAAGVRMLPEGEALADRLGLPRSDVLEQLEGHSLAAGFERLAGARGGRARVKLLWREAFPPRSFITWWRPWARRSPVHLALGYLYRMGWLAGHVGSGFRAWRQAHDAGPMDSTPQKRYGS
jgi:hypothetical protein